MKLLDAAILHRNLPPDWYQRGIKENLCQRYWHYRRFSEVGKLVEVSGGKILDVGSADGTFTKIILDRSKASMVIGIEALSASVAYARKRFAKNKKLNFRVADAQDLPFKSEEFDAVFCLEVLEHVFFPDKVLKEIKRVLKKNGYVVFLVPIENLLFRIIWFFWENTRGWVWKGTHVHKFNNREMFKLVKGEGLEVETEKNFLLGMLKAVKVRKR